MNFTVSTVPAPATNKSRRISSSQVRKVGIGVGLLYGVLIIVLESKLGASKLHTQVTAMTVPALFGPISMAAVLKGFGDLWFWIALPLCVALHVACVAHYFPLPNTLTAIVLGAIEGVVLSFVTGAVRDLLSRAA